MSGNEKRPLPDGWEWSTLDEVSKPERNRVKPQEFPKLPFIGMDDVESETMRLLNTKQSRDLKSSAEHFFPGDVLYGSLRPYLNKVYRPEFEGLCSAEFIVFRNSPVLDNKYLQYFLNQWSFVAFINRQNTGDRPRVKFNQMASYPFPLAPIPEQKRIVAEIEKQFTRLDQAIASLKRAQANLARYKGSVLKAACEGRLVPQDPDDEPAEKLLAHILAERRARWVEQEWRKLVEQAQKKAAQDRRKASSRPARPSDLQDAKWQDLPEEEYGRYLPKNDKWKEKYVEPAGVETAELPQLPNGWNWINLVVISNKITDGEHFRPKTIENGIYFLSAKDVREQGVTFNDPLYVSLEDAVRFRQRCDPDPNDILIVSRGATVGRSCIVQTDELFCLLGSVILIKPVSEIEARYLLYAIRSPSIHKRLVSLSGSTAQQAIYIRDIKSLCKRFVNKC